MMEAELHLDLSATGEAMHDHCALPPAASAACGLVLHRIWDVDVGDDYDVRPRRGTAQDHLVAAFSVHGRGQMELYDGRTISASADSLTVLPFRRLQRYRCLGRRWRFWWFQWTGDLPVPQGIALPLPWSREHEASCRHAFAELQSLDPARRRVAATRLELLLAEAGAEYSSIATAQPHAEALQRVVNALQEQPQRPWTVAGMARLAGLGERRFREVFTARTGRPPKRFLDQLRLRLAEHLLCATAQSVGEVARQVGYQDAFHFSRSFRAYFGVAPSQLTAGMPKSSSFRSR